MDENEKPLSWGEITSRAIERSKNINPQKYDKLSFRFGYIEGFGDCQRSATEVTPLGTDHKETEVFAFGNKKIEITYASDSKETIDMYKKEFVKPCVFFKTGDKL